ncbi:hypothetical protein [Streptomyces sp. RKAG293]|uniref:hypothetical protein n=1 Tax=Streptomyces sp. RKAG293 TaxID=2893403 RepID=UPI0020340ED8|nr:hypothetical protein [Streptomyces sp. RKAG293]MCM2416682.1 hypothetical protein [Streptomyces sp. RKAG293]
MSRLLLLLREVEVLRSQNQQLLTEQSSDAVPGMATQVADVMAAAVLTSAIAGLERGGPAVQPDRPEKIGIGIVLFLTFLLGTTFGVVRVSGLAPFGPTSEDGEGGTVRS